VKTLHNGLCGQVLLLVTIAIVVLLGFSALSVDIGLLYSTRRRMQTAADAAAIAGASALRDSQDYTKAAADVTSFNGFTNSQNNVTVAVSQPTLSSPYPSGVTYVEVDITQSVPTYFLRALGYKSMNVGARAVSGAVNGPACIYALDPSASGAVSLTGNINLNSACGLIDDSTSSSALSATGNINVQTTSTGIAGNYSSSGNITFSPTPKINLAPVPDPLSSLQPPTVPTCTQASTTNSGTYSISGNYTTLNLTPAVYSGGISVGGNIGTLNFGAGTYGNRISFVGNLTTANFNPGQYQNGGSGAVITLQGNTAANFAAGAYTFCGPLSISGNNTTTLQPGLYYGGISIVGNANVTFAPGTYILAGGGLSVTGNSTLTGTGVTFYNTSGLGGYSPINLTGNETANFSAPTSGSLKGILFFQDRSIVYSSSNGSTIKGNSSSTFNGAVYFPTTNLTYLGNSSSSGYTFLIADKITITGNSVIGNNYTSLNGGSPVQSSALYE
jgi:hypothetical protein